MTDTESPGADGAETTPATGAAAGGIIWAMGAGPAWAAATSRALSRPATFSMAPKTFSDESTVS